MFKHTKAIWRLYKNRERYYNDFSEPVRCVHCECLHIAENVQGYDNGLVTEAVYTCADCGAEISYRCDGFYEPQYPMTLRDVFSAFVYDLSQALSVRSKA